MSIDTCYACELPACTVEHCPPKSFFPEGQRDHLLTVASCAEHNNDNSKDVEYVRNVLTTLWGINTSGLELFAGKVKRSLDRSPKLLTRTFSTMQTVFHEGQLTGAFRLDIDRLENVFEACARAIHYHETRRKHTDWGILMPRLMFNPEVPETDRQKWVRLWEMLQTVGFARKSVGNPQVFEFGAADLEGNSLYCFVFYQGFPVYAIPLPKGLRRGLTDLSSEIKAKS